MTLTTVNGAHREVKRTFVVARSDAGILSPRPRSVSADHRLWRRPQSPTEIDDLALLNPRLPRSSESAMPVLDARLHIYDNAGPDSPVICPLTPRNTGFAPRYNCHALLDDDDDESNEDDAERKSTTSDNYSGNSSLGDSTSAVHGSAVSREILEPRLRSDSATDAISTALPLLYASSGTDLFASAGGDLSFSPWPLASLKQPLRTNRQQTKAQCQVLRRTSTGQLAPSANPHTSVHRRASAPTATLQTCLAVLHPESDDIPQRTPSESVQDDEDDDGCLSIEENHEPREIDRDSLNEQEYELERNDDGPDLEPSMEQDGSDTPESAKTSKKVASSEWDMPYRLSPAELSDHGSISPELCFPSIVGIENCGEDLISACERNTQRLDDAAALPDVFECATGSSVDQSENTRSSSLPEVHTGRRMSDAANGRFSIMHAQVVRRTSSMADIQIQRGRNRCPVQLLVKSPMPASPYVTTRTVSVAKSGSLGTVIEDATTATRAQDIVSAGKPRRLTISTWLPSRSPCHVQSPLSLGQRSPDNHPAFTASPHNNISQVTNPLVDQLKIKLAELSRQESQVALRAPRWLPLLESDRNQHMSPPAVDVLVPPNTKHHSRTSSNNQDDPFHTDPISTTVTTIEHRSARGSAHLSEHQSTHISQTDLSIQHSQEHKHPSSATHTFPNRPRRNSLPSASTSSSTRNFAQLLLAHHGDYGEEALLAKRHRDSVDLARLRLAENSATADVGDSSQLGLASRDSFLLIRRRLEKARMGSVEERRHGKGDTGELYSIADTSPPGERRGFHLSDESDEQEGCRGCSIHCGGAEAVV